MSDFDTSKAHKYFSAHFFNTTWSYIDKKERSDEDNEMMILNALSSLLHWKNRGDATDTNLSISYWQISRVYSLANNAPEALYYANKCFDVSKDGKTPPFYLTYGYEALALAEFLNNNNEKSSQHLQLAYKESQNIEDVEEKLMVLVDLDALTKKLS